MSRNREQVLTVSSSTLLILLFTSLLYQVLHVLLYSVALMLILHLVIPLFKLLVDSPNNYLCICHGRTLISMWAGL